MKLIASFSFLVLIEILDVNPLMAAPPFGHQPILKERTDEPVSGALSEAVSAIHTSFPIDAVWSGATEWMSGVNYNYEAYGGSLAKGVDFFGSTVMTTDYVPVKIVFESDTTLWSLAQVFRRDMSFNSFGVGKFPGSAWDISDSTNPRRLNLCIAEESDVADPLHPPNLRWDPDTSLYGRYELLFVMNSDYDGTGTTYAGNNIKDDILDVLYAWWPRLVAGHTFLESIPSSLSILPRINLSARQKGYNVILKWFSPGHPPDYYKLFFSIGATPDSLLAVLSSTDSTFTHADLLHGQEYHYIIKSFGAADNEILSSREALAAVRSLPPISSVFPAAQKIQAATMTDIVVTFDSVMNPSTINSSTFKVFGHWSGPKSGAYQMENGNTRVRFTPDEPFSAGEWVLASLSRSIETINGTNLPSGYAWSFWIKTKLSFLNMVKTQQISVRAPGEGLVQCYGAYGGDINDDGFSDITVVNEISNDVRVFLNDGSGGYGNFTIYPINLINAGGDASPNDGADFNSDGKIDMAIGSRHWSQVRVILNDGTGGFNSPASLTAGNDVRGVAILDLNGDGHDDIATANSGSSIVYTLLNNGDGSFAAATPIETSSSGGSACASGDANNDGILDLFVSAYGGSEMILLLGDGNGGLVHSATVNSGGGTWMMATGDINLDGNIDVACANAAGDNASVIFGDGLGSLSDPVIYPAPAFPIAMDLGDIDGDGDLEMVTSSFGGAKFRVFENDGSGNYVKPKDYPAARAASCITLHDRNNDGIMDMTGIDEIQDIIILFESYCCIGNRGDLNSDGRNCSMLDLNFLVNFIFRSSGKPGRCPQESDVNGDGSIPDILDLNFLVNVIFRNSTPPPACF